MLKTVFVTFVGKPNVGKSSLINCLVGKTVSIVSKKPQTTRNKIAGIKTIGKEQFVFLDTPGIFNAKNVLGKKMVKSIFDSIYDVECGVLVVNFKNEIDEFEKKLIEKFNKNKVPLILAINKIDLIKNKNKLIKMVKIFNSVFKFCAIVFVSAKLKQGLNVLLNEIKKHEIESNHFFPDDVSTDKSEEFVVSELFRQKLLLNLKEEVPHSLIVEVEKFKQTSYGLKISVIIYCLKHNHKAIIIGKNGNMLKKIASESRVSMENFFNCKIHLNCWVKVKPKLNENEFFLKKFF